MTDNLPGYAETVTSVSDAEKQLKNIEASLTRAINQIRSSCINLPDKQRFVEDLNEIAFEIHHLTPKDDYLYTR